jgi:hypothetical protein
MKMANPDLRLKLQNKTFITAPGVRLGRREIECVGEDGRIRHRAGERVRDLKYDRRSPDVRAERARSSRDGHEDEVRLARWAAQVQRAGDPWCGATAVRPKGRQELLDESSQGLAGMTINAAGVT